MLFDDFTDTFAVIEEYLVLSGDHFGALRLLMRNFCVHRRGFGPPRRPFRCSSVLPQTFLPSSKRIWFTPVTTLVLFVYSTDNFAVIAEDVVHSSDHFGARWLLQRHCCSHRRGFGPLQRRLWCSSVSQQTLLQSSKRICSTLETTLVLFGYSTDTLQSLERTWFTPQTMFVLFGYSTEIFALIE